MNKSSTPVTDSRFLTIFLLISLILVVFLVLTDRKFLWVTGFKSAVIIVGIIGMTLCSRGIGRVAEAGEWTHPLAIISYVIGVMIIAIIVLVSLNKPVPIVSSPRNALLVIISLIGIKFVISMIHMAILNRI